MASTKYLLIGGGLACLEAAKQIRRLDPDGAVMMASEEPHLPYDRPPLSKEFMRGEKAPGELLLAGEDFFDDIRIDLMLSTRVESLDAEAKTAGLAGGETVTYEKALLATGGSPIRLAIGKGQQNVHYLRAMEDSRAIGGEAAPGKRAVIVGAGFIGLETAASLTQKGVQVAVLEAMPHIWPRFASEELAGHFQRYCESKGVSFVVNDAVAELRGEGRHTVAVTKSGKELPCDFACIGVGIRPNVELAEGAGLSVDNGVVVDERMQSSDPSVYAAGDIVNYPDPIFEKRRRVEHWGHAEYTGQIAGQNMAGGDAKYDMLSYVWSDIFDLHLEFAGDEHEHDQVLVRGSMEDNSFTVLYLNGGILRAYFAVNTEAREFPVFQRFIRRKKDLSGLTEQLTDTSVSLRSLL